MYSSVTYDNVKIYDSYKVRGPGGFTVEYTEEGLHRPLPSYFYGADSDGTQLFSFDKVTPHTGEETSRLRLPFEMLEDSAGNHSGTFVMDRLEIMRFIVITYKANMQDVKIYGWIDGYRIVGSGGPRSVVDIDWHIDYFLSYPSANYRGGRLLRGPEEYSRPDPSEPRMWIEDSAVVITDNEDEEFWVIVLYTVNHKVSDEKVYTQYELAFWQNGEPVGNAPSPSIFDCYDGLLEEYLELDPNTIKGVWVSPIKPMDTTSATARTNTGGTRGWYAASPSMIEQTIQDLDITDPIWTSDDVKYNIVDPTGGIVASLPWHLPFNRLLMTLDIGPAGAYLEAEFADTNQLTRGRGEGRIVSIPLLSVPVTENAMASYVYSGEREYDKEMRRIQKDQAAVNGIAGIGTSAIGGAIAGSMVAPGPGTIAGAAAGIVSAGVGTAVNYFTAEAFDNKTQRAIDMLKSNQAAADIISAGGLAWYFTGRKWYLVGMKRDDISDAELQRDHDELGWPTDLYLDSCYFVTSPTGGGYRIQDLDVTGVGKKGAEYIRALFARGVHIDSTI